MISLLYVDESTLDTTERLGLAWCRLNCFLWDEIAGPVPEGFEDLPDNTSDPMQLCKKYYVNPVCHAIESIIGHANVSRCWWLFALGKSEEDWLQWYLTKDIPSNKWCTKRMWTTQDRFYVITSKGKKFLKQAKRQARKNKITEAVAAMKRFLLFLSRLLHKVQ